jgi:hypothetical protein
MRQVPQIKAAYDWMIAAYQAEVSAAMATGNTNAVVRLEETRDALERGVFVTLFAQFESVVTDYFVQARNVRSANPDWTSRRGWDIPAYLDRRVPFETKLALVLDQRESSRAKVMQADSLRNHCAHGGSSEPVGSIDQFVNDLYTWQALLRK